MPVSPLTGSDTQIAALKAPGAEKVYSEIAGTFLAIGIGGGPKYPDWRGAMGGVLLKGGGRFWPRLLANGQVRAFALVKPLAPPDDLSRQLICGPIEA
jgi:hypothetical protein